MRVAVAMVVKTRARLVAACKHLNTSVEGQAGEAATHLHNLLSQRTQQQQAAYVMSQHPAFTRDSRADMTSERRNILCLELLYLARSSRSRFCPGDRPSSPSSSSIGVGLREVDAASNA